MKHRTTFKIFFFLVCLALLGVLFNFKSFFFPFVTSKAFFARIVIEAALPFYFYLLFTDKTLRPALRQPLTAAVLVFLLVNIISSLFGVDFYRSFWGSFERMGGIYYLAHMTLLYLYILLLAQKGGVYIKRLVQILLAIVGIVVLNGLFGKLGLPTLNNDPSLPARVSSTLGNPIFLASFLILPLTFGLFFFLQETERKKKYFYGILSFLILLIIYFTGTRGAIVGLAAGGLVGLLAYAWLSKNRKFKIWSFSLAGILIAAGILLVVLNSHLPQGSTLQRLSNFNDANSQARLMQWQTALRGFKDSPILGTGTENYYVVANQYYDSKLAQFDASWFDKPHNYWLEILDTNGMVGLVTYLFIFVLSLWIVRRVYKAELLTAGEAAVLMFGLVAYQVQNLFVFDTIPASLTYFVFLGFLSYLYLETKEQKKSEKKFIASPVAFPTFWGSAVVMAYTIYVTNVLPIQLGTNINYGLTLGNKQEFVESKKYFDQALKVNTSFDRRALFSYYSDMALAAAQSQAVVSPEFVQTALKQGIDLGETTIKQEPKNPVNWYYVSALAYFNSVVSKQDLPQKSLDALAEAVKLAPERREVLYFDVKLKGARNMWAEALVAAEKYHELYPQFEQSAWELAWVKYKLGDLDGAFETAEKAVEQGFKPLTLTEHRLFIDYYESKQNLAKVVEWYEKAVQAVPQNVEAYLGLVQAYANNKQDAEARDLAKQIVEADPSQREKLARWLQ